MTRLLTLALTLTFALSAHAQFDDTQGNPRDDKSNFQAITSGGAASELSEIHSALKEISELESDNAGAEAPKNLAGAIKVQVDRVIRAYRTLLGMSGHAQEVLEVGENPDEEWKNVWLLLRRDLQKAMPRGSELEKTWHEAFNVDAEVAFEAALEVRDLAALMLVGVRYPFAPAALRATKASADLAFAEGQRALAAKGYSALMALEPFQSVSRQDLALAAIKGFLCTRELGWRKAEGEFKSWIDANPAAAVLWGEERKPIGALLLDFEKAIPSFDTLELQLGESLVSMPMATLAGQPSKAEPKNLETQAWPSLKIKGPLSPRTSYAMKNLLEVEVSPVIPTVTPTSILVNTGEALYGFDFLSGKSLWGDGVRLEAPRDAFHYSEQDPNLILTAARWQDLVIAPLENPLSKSTDAPKAKSSFGGSVFSHFPVVRRALVGVDQASGNILWTLGGQYRLRSDQASLPDLEKRIAVTSFFTLTVVDDVIYALGTTRENESQLHLVAIDPAQGKPMWSVLLGAGQGESNMFGNPMRDAMPGIPVVAEGVLYVQSNLGAVMAVEIASQRVLWVSRYEALPRPFTRIRSTAYRKVTHANGAPILTRDKKGNLLLIVAPTDSRFITAFDAESGEVRWRTQTENAQSHPNGRIDAENMKPNVMIGVHSGALYLGLKDWIFQLSVEGGEVLGRWDSEARSGRVSARAPLDGRPVIGGSTLYWPSSVGLITIDLSSGKLPDKAQEFIDGNFGNLQVARGALVNFAGKAYISSLDIAGVLEVRFDQSELLAQAEREVKANPMDPRAKLRLVQLAQQIEGVEGFDIERIEALLREVISLAEGKADTADVLASARRSLFDVLVAKAQRALSSQDFVAFPRFMQEAGALADSDAQRLTIFLLEESYAIDNGDVEGKIAFYSRIAAASPRFSLSLRGLNVPSRVYALWNLAGLYSQSKQGAQALACLDQILGWGQSDGATSGLLQEVQQQISTIYFSTPEAYQGLDEDAAQAFADASSHTGVASAREMLALADRYRHSGVFTQALRQAAIRSADDEAFLATSSLTLSLTRDRPNDRAKAETLAALLVLHIHRKERIHVLQVASVLSDFDASLSLTVDGKGTTLGSFLKELGLDSLSFTQENAPVAMPSKFDAEALWKESFTISTEVDARYLEILQIVPRSDNESDVTFLNVSKGIPELVAIETESGKELWRISNGVVYAGVVRVGENFVLHDGQSIIAVNRTSGIKQWDIEGAGAMLDFEHYAGLGVVTYYERYAGRTYVGAQIIDLTKGSEIWKLRFGQTSQTTLGVRGRWLYVVDVTSPAEAHVKRLNLLTGEEELRQPFPYHIDGSSTMQFAGDTEIVLHGRDPRSKRVLVMTINTATLESKPLLGPLSSVPDIAVSGDRIAVVSSDGLGAIYSLKERKALHSLTEQVENATVRSVQIKGDRVIVEWRPQAQTYSVWFTCYSLSSGKKLMHQEVWKASEGVQVANFDSHLSHYDKGIVVTIAHTIRVERRVGRVIQYAFESQPLEVLVIDIEKLTTHKQPLFEGARQMSYMIPLEFLALATEKGLLMSDGVNQVALFGAKR